MSILLECGCGKKLKVRDELAGKKVKCPGCASVLSAPAPVVEEAATEVMAGDAPIMVSPRAADKDDEKKPVWASKQSRDDDDEEQEAKSRKDDDDDDDENKPGPYWEFPGAFSTEVMALAPEGIWFASLKGEALEKALNLLKKGNRPGGEVLGEKAYYIPWVMIQNIYCNKKLNGFTITYTNEGETTSKVMTPSDADARNKIMDDIEDYMEPDVERLVYKHNALSASLSPILAMGITFTIALGLAILSLFLSGEATGTGRGAAVAALLNLIAWLGPLGNCGIGFLIIGFEGIWMVVRMINPPIDITLKPVTATPGAEE